MNSVVSIFENIMNLAADTIKVPDVVEQTFAIYPESVLECLDYFERTLDDGCIKNKQPQLSLLFNEAFTRLRYKLDNGESEAKNILDQAHHMLKTRLADMGIEKKMIITCALHDSKLPTPELDYVENADSLAVLKSIPNIAPQLPALLDQIRREGGLSSPFQLYDFLIAQIQIQPMEIQCALINELIVAKNAPIQDVGVFMLLHPKKLIRRMVPLIWLDNFINGKIRISPISLRRFIVIRNWLPYDEQSAIDTLIQQIRKTKIMPAPHPSSKITRLISSIVDGAGVQCFLFETKAKNQRTIAGFLVKNAIGIREPFVIHKAHAEEFSHMLKQYTLPAKSVSTTYTSKLVAHFISIGQQENHIPEPIFLEIAELFGVQQWLPQPIDPMTEINRIKEQENLDTNDPILIEQALKYSAVWTETADFAQSWFETGECVNSIIIEAVETHSKMKAHALDTLPKITTRALMKDDLLNKWIFILTRMLLWHRSKSIKGEEWKYFLVIAEKLLQGYPVEDIPLMQEITKRSVAHSVQWQRI
ncbi:MAG: hypothetical protein EBY22_06845 [Gammaproteobacteria bacterium]|jgi:hypothetical protein|nr:hypothetical protein [Gammaproteobacteria bacterium]